MIEILTQLEKEDVQYFHYFPLHKIIKQIFRRRFDFDDTKKKLSAKMQVQNKKKMHNDRFYENFPNPIPINFLEGPDLLELDLKNTLFLIDGNNIMPKQKHFRDYFESES